MSAVTQNSYIGNGSTTNYSFTFPYLKSTDVEVQVDATVTTAWQFANATTVQFNTAPANGAKIKILRQTNVDSLAATFYAGSAIKSEDLNDNYTQNLYKTQEVGQRFFSNTGGTMTGDLTMAEDTSIIFEGATDDNFETTLAIADPTADRTITLPNVTGTVITTGDTGTITSSMIADGTITIGDIANGAIATEKINNDAVTSDKIANDAINSEHYAATSIDTEHIANENITTAKLANDAVTSSKLADNAVLTANITDANVTHTKLANDAVDGDNIANDSINSEHYVDGSIDTAHISNDAINGDKIANDAINSEHYVNGSIDHVHLSNDCIDGDNIQDNAVGAEHIQANAVTDSEIATGTLDNRYFTETELTNGALDGRYFTETESDARYFNISSGDTIKDGDSFPDNDTTIATTAAINDRIIDLVDDVGGFVPIASETAFPTANPDVNNGAGTLVSIKAIGTTRTPSGGTVTIANGSGSNTVTITGCGSTVLTAGFGVIVETTSTLHTYAFHRLVPKATEVTTVAGSISNVNSVAGSISNVNTTASNISNVNTVAGINANVTTVAGISSDVTTVANNNSNVTAVADNASNINSVASNASNINSAVSNASNINSAVSNESNINSAVSNASNINTVAGSISNVNTAATNIASINTAASNITNVNNFTDRYQIASSNPSTDGGGNALAEGDLFFNTTSNELKVYNGSAWQGGVTATGNFANTTGDTYTGTNVHNDNAKSIYGTGSDGLEIYHSGTHSFIDETGTGNLYIRNGTKNSIWCQTDGAVKLYHNDSPKVTTLDSGVNISGNITLTGNVDGRDVAADGTKLDGIEASATADQTASEIVSLLSNQNISTTGTLASGNLTATGTQHKFTSGTSGDCEVIIEADTDNNNENDNPKLLFRQDGGVDASCFEQVDNKLTISNSISSGGISFKTGTTNGYTNATERLSIAGSGTVDVAGNLDVGAGLDVTGDITITDGSPSILFSDVSGSPQDPDYKIQANAGIFEIYDDTNSATRLKINSDGHVDVVGNLDVGAGLDVTGQITSTGHIDVPDYARLKLGNDDDLQIYHDASASYIEDSGTGGLYVKSNYLGFRSTGGETLANFNENGNVELYHDNVKKFETTSTGATTTGYQLVSNPGNTAYLRIGAGATDNQYAHLDLVGDTTYSSYGFRILRGNSGSGTSTNLYHRGSGWLALNAQDTGGGILFQTEGTSRWRVDDDGTFRNANDDTRIKLGTSDDLQIYHDGSHSRILDNGTGNLILSSSHLQINNAANTEVQAKFIQDGAVELYHNGAKKFNTAAHGAEVTGNFNITSELGLFNGTTNASRYIDAGLGDGNAFYIRGCSGGDTGHENLIVAQRNGGVELYYDANKKFETTTTGATVTGNLIASHTNGRVDVNASDGSVEITRVAGSPFIDFKDSTSEDYDHRLSASSDGFNFNDTINLETSGFVHLNIKSTNNDAVLQLTANNDDDKDWTIRNDYSDSFKLNFRYNNANRMKLDSSGNLSITGDLHLDNADRVIWGTSDTAYIEGDDNNYLIFGVNNEKARLTTTGLGIGTTSPAGKVHANSATNTATFLAEGEVDSPDYPAYGFSGQNHDNGSRGTGMYLPGDGQLAFATAATERLRIDANGNFDINNGAIMSSYADDNNIDHFWHSDGVNAWIFNSDTTIKATTGTSSLRCAAIDFGDSNNAADKLDEYEEGTWTPELKFGGSSSGITYSHRTGVYTKIGRVVTVHFAFAITDKGNQTGHAEIHGIPFDSGDYLSNTTVESNGNASFWNNVVPNGHNMMYHTNGSHIEIKYIGSTGEDQPPDMSNSNFEDNTSMRGSLTYFTAT